MPSVCVARCPLWPARLCRLPRARPNLTKPVTALLPYVPICAKQIWMENSWGWGDARKVENTGFTCDAMPESWNDLGFLMLCAFKTGPFLIFAHIVFLSIDHLLSLQRNLTNWPPPPDRGYPGSPFYLLVASSFPGERKPLNKI